MQHGLMMMIVSVYSMMNNINTVRTWDVKASSANKKEEKTYDIVRTYVHTTQMTDPTYLVPYVRYAIRVGHTCTYIHCRSTYVQYRYSAVYVDTYMC